METIFGSIVAFVVAVAALVAVVVKLLKYCDGRRDKRRAEKRSEEMARREQERQRQREAERQRQANCTHIWELLTNVNGADYSLASRPIECACYLCGASQGNVAIIEVVHCYEGPDEHHSYIANWHNYYPLPMKGLTLPVPGEPHSENCRCQTCQQQKAAAVSVYAAAAERQNNCKHRWGLQSYDSSALLQHLDAPVEYYCPSCGATYTGSLRRNPQKPKDGAWRMVLDNRPLPAKGTKEPEDNDEHSSFCGCHTCVYAHGKKGGPELFWLVEGTDYAYVSGEAEVSGGNSYDDVDDLPF